MKVRLAISCAVIGFCLCVTGGCGPSGRDMYAALQAENPSVRIQAIHRAGQTKDTSSLPYLVDRLSDSQSDVRFFAISALKRITGEDMGWNYYDPPEKRAEAVGRWGKYLAERSQAVEDKK